MRPADLVLLAIDAAEHPLQPVQLQKALFLLEERTPKELLDVGLRYKFKAYDYGPFSADIYFDAEILEREGLISIRRPPASRYKEYSITEQGRSVAAGIRGQLNSSVGGYLAELVAFTQKLSFNQLVNSIYQLYPAMKANSVFQDRT